MERSWILSGCRNYEFIPHGSAGMPVISVDIAPLTIEVKEELIKSLTKTASSITKIPESSFVVLVKEYPTDAIGVGGTPLSKR